MKRIVLQASNGSKTEAFVPEEESELKQQLANDRRQNFKEHLYMGYLLVGTVAFVLGIFLTLKRLNGK